MEKRDLEQTKSSKQWGLKSLGPHSSSLRRYRAKSPPPPKKKVTGFALVVRRMVGEDGTGKGALDF